MTLQEIGTMHAMDQAFSGVDCHSIATDGEARLLDVRQWRDEADEDDLALFIDQCTGTTLDVGCGPGRLAAALAGRGVPSMGIDMSIEAIRQARERGAVAIRRNVFSHVPGEGRWDCALLADGNLGIGGDPVRLLQRVADLIRPGGTIIAEVEPEGTGILRKRIRLRVGNQITAPFDWASVGLDVIHETAERAGLVVIDTRTVNDRHTATMCRAFL